VAAPTITQVAIADRRALVRVCFVALDLALLVTIVVLLLQGDKSWWLVCPGLVALACLTYLWGWSVPAGVDAWRREQADRTQPATRPRGTDGTAA
jgi:hypothetical protein